MHFSFLLTSKHKGFTLVELMIVIAIIGLLAVALLPKLTGAQANARDVKRKKELADISQALDVMYDERFSYPFLKNKFETNDTDFKQQTGFWAKDSERSISDNLGNTAPFLAEKLDGGKVPVDVSKMKHGCYGPCVSILPAGEEFAYRYAGLADDNDRFIVGYALIATVENYRNANVRPTYLPAGGSYPFAIADGGLENYGNFGRASTWGWAKTLIGAAPETKDLAEGQINVFAMMKVPE